MKCPFDVTDFRDGALVKMMRRPHGSRKDTRGEGVSAFTFLNVNPL